MGSGRIHTSVKVGDPGFLLSVCFFFSGGVCVYVYVPVWIGVVCVTTNADRYVRETQKTRGITKGLARSTKL